MDAMGSVPETGSVPEAWFTGWLYTQMMNNGIIYPALVTENDVPSRLNFNSNS
jgi:hypothetical protein